MPWADRREAGSISAVIRTRALLAAVAFSCILAPASASAVQETLWDFTGGTVPGDWQAIGLQLVQPTAEGLRVRSATEGQLLHLNDAAHPGDAISIRVGSARDFDARVLWRPRDGAEGDLIQLPVFFPAGVHTVRVNVLEYDVWDPMTPQIGLWLPAGSDLVIHSVALHRWSVAEKVVEMWKSFWKFDGMQPYTINFIWGPMLQRTPIGTENLWEEDPPPHGWSVGRFLVPILAIAGFAILAHWALRRDRRNARFLGAPAHAAAFALVAAVLWIGFDVRMGLETLNYAREDWITWISRAPGNRTFRRVWDLDDVMSQALPELRGVKRFAFVSPPGLPVAARIRYATYPSLPAIGGDDRTGIDTWVVYRRPDILSPSGNAILLEGVTHSGTVLKRLGTGSFLFRSR